MKKRMRQVMAHREGPRPDEVAGRLGAWPLAEPFRIGEVEIENRIVQAPLAGIANWAFRRQSMRHGAGLAVSEMVASFGIHYANAKTLAMLDVVRDERPVAIQIFGTDPEVMAEAACAVEEAGADLVDINMGCPVNKVTKTGAGASLLANEGERGAAIVRAMADAVRIPVMVKMRRGLTPSSARPVEAAKRFQDAGAAAITFHPRAAAEEYAGRADHAITALVASGVDIPVIASGDITTPAQALEVFERTGCAAIAVGRAIMGDPWLFGSLATGVTRTRPTLDEVVDEIERFAIDLREAVGENRAGAEIRKYYAWYLAGYPVDRNVLGSLQTDPTLDGALDRLRSLVESDVVSAA
jgi:tRNA-dihydrouridine synthase B